MKRGAPTKYSEEMAEDICDIISTTNRGLRSICAELNISTRSVLRWLRDYPEFVDMYNRAKREQADNLVEEMLEIADDNTKDTIEIEGKRGQMVKVEDREWVNRSRLKVDTRKFIAAKLRPEKYGDKLATTNTNLNTNMNITIEVVKTNTDIATSEDKVDV